MILRIVTSLCSQLKVLTTMALKLPHSKVIEKYVVAKIKAGVAIKDILGGIQKYQNAPRSIKGLYSVYGEAIYTARNDLVAEVGNRVIDQALAGDYKSQELFLRSKGGWSPTQTIQEQEIDGDPEHDETAVDTLMTLLGKTGSDDKEDE